MENIWNGIIEKLSSYDVNIDGISLEKLIFAVIVFTVVQALRKLFSSLILDSIERLAGETETTLDDELIEIIKQPLNWLITIGGLRLVQLILASDLREDINQTVIGLINLSAIGVVCLIIYRASPVLGELLGNLAGETETELDDLIVPYLPRIFQTIAILIVVLKAGEVLLGASAGALIGLLGGAGLTLGLLLKDIVYDWFCTILIFTDSIYRTGDVVVMEEINGICRVNQIGLRSTTLCLLGKEAIKKIPNSKMVTGVVENWSQNSGDKQLLCIDLNLQIDDIPSVQTERICNALRAMPDLIDDLSPQCYVWFSGFTQNARMIETKFFSKADCVETYYSTWEQLNLEILKLLEKEGIELLASTPIAILPMETETHEELEKVVY